MDVEKEKDGQKTVEEETVNSRKAIWLRSKSENTPEEYNDFYRQISFDHEAPAKVIHYSAEGAQEFKALLFVPAHKPLEMQFGGDQDWGPRLYIQRVLIMEHCEALLPPYLRFVKGVVDSSDLPLNISRELLQDNPLLERIRKNVTRSILKGLEELKTDDYEKYVAFYKELGSILKEGPRVDFENRERIADLFLFESLNTPAGKFTTLGEYVDKMPAEQKEIFFLSGETREQLVYSPYVESYRAGGQDVLLFTDPIDEFMVGALREYRGKTLKPVDRVEAGDGGADSALKEKYAKLLAALKEKLPEVADVRLTGRLKESAACLVAAEGSVSAHMERLLERWGKADSFGPARRVLEMNGTHPVVEALLRLFEKDQHDPRVEAHARLLYDQAVIAEGSRVKDPAALARRINDLLVRDAGA
jgi:molecular chaperone HtpG